MAIAACLTLLSTAAGAKQPTPNNTIYGQPNEAELASHGHYRNKDGQEMHSPSKSNTGKAPQGASAQCRDGSYSFSTHHRGTCSRHGGVAMWLQ